MKYIEKIMNRSKTLGDVLRASGGAGAGFDFMRFALALLILVAHCSRLNGHSGTTSFIVGILESVKDFIFSTSDLAGSASFKANHIGAGVDNQPTASGPLFRSLVPMFFALSGFLVTGSALRTPNLLKFLGLRALRIFPALVVEVFLCAVVLGAIFTTLPIASYFSDPEFFSYFLNVLGVVHFSLPGVFKESYDTAVNANLWTLPYELESYILMSVLMVMGLLTRLPRILIAYVIGATALILSNFYFDYGASTAATLGGRVQVFYFFTGVIFFLLRDRIPYSPVLLVIGIVVSYVFFRTAHLVFFAPVFLTYVTIYLGVTRLRLPKLLKSGDYSYGVYLYGYPISQAVVAVLGPGSTHGAFLFNTALSLFLTFLFSVASWHLVEKHCLRLKKYVLGAGRVGA